MSSDLGEHRNLLSFLDTSSDSETESDADSEAVFYDDMSQTTDADLDSDLDLLDGVSKFYTVTQFVLFLCVNVIIHFGLYLVGFISILFSICMWASG